MGKVGLKLDMEPEESFDGTLTLNKDCLSCRSIAADTDVS